MAGKTARPYALKSAVANMIDGLANVEWFAAIGSPLHNKAVVRLRSIQEAEKCARSEQWESLKLEMQNNLTMFMHKNARQRYQRWNDFIDAVEERWDPISAGPLSRASQARHLPDRVRGELLGVVAFTAAEQEFADLSPPIFFSHLLEWYRKGRLPCGWGGRNWLGRIRLSAIAQTYDPADSTATFNWPVFALSLPSVPLPHGKLLVF